MAILPSVCQAGGKAGITVNFVALVPGRRLLACHSSSPRSLADEQLQSNGFLHYELDYSIYGTIMQYMPTEMGFDEQLTGAFGSSRMKLRSEVDASDDEVVLRMRMLHEARV